MGLKINPFNLNLIYMKRRNFIQLSGMGAGALMVPMSMMGNNISAEALLAPGMDVIVKKRMADVALNTAKSMGATYGDARIGRYLNQYVFTREDKVQNVVNTESNPVPESHCF